MRVAYADPPYPGQARKHYRRDPSGIVAAEVNHAALIARLSADYPDGWALSTSSSALREVLALCPPDARVGAWVKPFAVFRPGVNPAYAWEPVVWRGGRRQRSRREATVRDWVSANILLKTGTHGAKPDAFCWWLFELLGLQPRDIFDDLYPGSGRVGRAWATWQARLALEAMPIRPNVPEVDAS
jgi:hypothetical protein